MVPRRTLLNHHWRPLADCINNRLLAVPLQPAPQRYHFIKPHQRTSWFSVSFQLKLLSLKPYVFVVSWPCLLLKPLCVWRVERFCFLTLVCSVCTSHYKLLQPKFTRTIYLRVIFALRNRPKHNNYRNSTSSINVIFKYLNPLEMTTSLSIGLLLLPLFGAFIIHC